MVRISSSRKYMHALRYVLYARTALWVDEWNTLGERSTECRDSDREDHRK